MASTQSYGRRATAPSALPSVVDPGGTLGGLAFPSGGTVQLRVHEREVGGTTVLSLDGELDLVTAPLLRQKVVSAVSEGARRLVLDLEGLTHLDSTGLGQVIATLRRVRAHDGDLAVVVPDPRVRRIFQVCDLDRVLTLHRTVEEALAQTGAV